MIPPFDIFRVEGGHPIWLDTALSLEAAKARVEAIGAERPGTYLILGVYSGQKIAIEITPDSRANSKTA